MVSISRLALDRRVAESKTSEWPRIGSAHGLLRDDRQVDWIQPEPRSLHDLIDSLRVLGQVPNHAPRRARIFRAFKSIRAAAYSISTEYRKTLEEFMWFGRSPVFAYDDRIRWRNAPIETAFATAMPCMPILHLPETAAMTRKADQAWRLQLLAGLLHSASTARYSSPRPWP